MNCEGCKWYSNKPGHVPMCVKYQTDKPVKKCIDYRKKQGQRTKI